MEQKTCPKCGDVLDSPTCYRCAPDAQYYARPSQPEYRAHPSSEGSPFAVIGVLIFIVGIILIIGNITGLFPTFPFAGFICTLIGGWIAKL